MKTAYSYVRLSSKRQTRPGASGEQRQLAKPIEICKANGWTLSTKTFSDLGVSGFSGKNRLKGDLGNFIKLAKEKKLGEDPVLILEAFDRFSRQDINSSEPAIIDLLNSGVDIHVAFSNKTFTKQSTVEIGDRIEILVTLKQAYEYSANLSKRIKAANVSLKSKINSGDIIKTRNTPYYYSFEKGQYVQNEKSETVKRIIKEFIAGKTLYSICTGLNDDGVKTIGYKGDGKWQIMSVKNILKNEALFGKFYDNESFYSHPITDKATFDKIQMLLTTVKHHKGRHSSEFINIFRGLLKCPICKESFSSYSNHLNRRTGKAHAQPYRYIRCSGVSNGTGCANKHTLNLKSLEDEFFGVFLKKDPKHLFKTNGSNNQSEIDNLDKQLGKVSATIAKLLSLDVDLTELQDKLGELKKEKDSLLKQKQELTTKDIKTSDNEQMAINFQKLYAEMIDPSADEGTANVNFNDAILAMREKLKDNELRLKLRTMLPSIISKMEINSIKQEWTVFDLTGKHIYTSMVN